LPLETAHRRQVGGDRSRPHCPIEFGIAPEIGTVTHRLRPAFSLTPAFRSAGAQFDSKRFGTDTHALAFGFGFADRYASGVFAVLVCEAS